jgi:hypothetical protein
MDSITTPEEEINITYTNTSSDISPEVQRLTRLVQMTAKFASTMALRPIQAHIDLTFTQDAPAWSDSDNIWFNKFKVGDLTDPKRMTAAKGLTIHEISHILLTPRSGSNIVKWVRTNKLWEAFNALEDMRIETLMTARYPAISQWLVGTIANFLLDKKAYYTTQFPILWGRKYLPLDVRIASANVFKDQTVVARLKEIIDTYVTLNLADRKAIPVAQTIIEEYNKLINDALNNNNSLYPMSPSDVFKSMGDPNGHLDRKNAQWKPSDSSPLDKATQDAMANRVIKQILNETSTADALPLSEPSSSLMARDAEWQGALNDMADRNSKRLEPELQNMAKQLSGDAGLKVGNVAVPKRAQGWDSSVQPETVPVVKSFTRELMAIKSEHDPGWDKHMSSGKLNVQRYSQGCDVEEAFDQWNMGREDAVDIECVILLDTSPSMNWCIDEAYQSMWVVKRAMDKIGASATVITYDSDARILYAGNERATLKVRRADRGDSTAPLNALKYARQLIADSQRAVKMLLTITDGQWAQTQDCDDIIRNLRNNGIITGLAYVDDTEWWKINYPNSSLSLRGPSSVDTHGCEVATLVNKPQELAQFARKLVKASIARNLERV